MANCNPVDVLFQRRCTNFQCVTPQGLPELMSDISREVLRCQPKNLCTFIADYLDALLITRENAKVAYRLVNGLADTSSIIAQLLNRLEISSHQAKQAAKIIQRAFRKHLQDKRQKCTCPADEQFDSACVIEELLQRCNISKDKATKAALIIQRAYHSYRARLELRGPYGPIDWRAASRRTTDILKGLNLPAWEAKQAATLIKAAYKGYYTRRLLRNMVQKKAKKSKTVPINKNLVPDLLMSEEHEAQFIGYDKITDEIQIKAAITIQRAFRAYSARKSNLWSIEMEEAYKELAKIIKLNVRNLHSVEDILG